MPLFNNSSSNINPDVDPNEIPIDELPKIEGRRRLSLKKSFFTWSSQKQYIDKNKFLFDSNTFLATKKNKKDRHNSYIIKSNKYATSGSSINYDESENEYSSESDINDESDTKDYYSMEDLDNISALKKKYPKVRNVTQLSESTLCYSSNTNTINTVSMEFGKTKPVSNNDVNNFEENQNNEEAINYGFEENQNNEEVINYGFEENNKTNEDSKNNEEVINYGFEEMNNNNNNNKTNEDPKNNDEVINYGFEETTNKNEDDEVINYGFVEGKNNEIDQNSEEDSNFDVDADDEDNYDDENYDNYSYESNSSSQSISPSKATSRSKPVKKVTLIKKTVTFCDDIEIIEPRKHKKAKNIFKRAISKIIRKKDEEDDDQIHDV